MMTGLLKNGKTMQIETLIKNRNNNANVNLNYHIEIRKDILRLFVLTITKSIECLEKGYNQGLTRLISIVV
jgi:hypothetical protein